MDWTLRDKPHVLIVDDDDNMREVTTINLTGEGFRVTSVDSAEKALLSVGQESPDLLLISTELPGLGGRELCQVLKADQKFHALSIIMLSNNNDEHDILNCFESGGDDFLQKPFSSRVLVARINAILRRKNGNIMRKEDKKSIIRLQNLVIHQDRHQVFQSDKTIELTATEFRVLSYLAKHEGRVLSREQIVNHIHNDGKPVTERSVDVLIVMLRRKLGDEGAKIETIRGVGYRFNDSKDILATIN